jgi:hypothetical protein
MKCKSKLCDLDIRHPGKCRGVVVVNSEPTVVNNGSRQVLWQQANRDRYNAKMREYMRKRRARDAGNENADIPSGAVRPGGDRS